MGTVEMFYDEVLTAYYYDVFSIKDIFTLLYSLLTEEYNVLHLKRVVFSACHLKSELWLSLIVFLPCNSLLPTSSFGLIQTCNSG